MRARKTRITCEEELFSDTTNYSSQFSYPPKKTKFGFEEQKNYRIDSLVQ